MVARVRLGQFQRAWNGHCRRAECLDWLLIIGRRHLAHVLRIYIQHYNRERPHRGRALQPPEPLQVKQPPGCEVAAVIDSARLSRSS